MSLPQIKWTRLNGPTEATRVTGSIAAFTAACVADYSCVEVCPADCIAPRPHEPGFDAAEQLYIDPATCIDCAACVDACDSIMNRLNRPRRLIGYYSLNGIRKGIGFRNMAIKELNK